MTYLLDTSTLIALAWENHDDHAAAAQWFTGVRAFATCPMTQGGFIRISAHPKLGYATGPQDAFAFLDVLLADPRHKFWPDSLSFGESEIQREHIIGHGRVTDHYLVALARRNNGSLATFDQPLCQAFAAEPNLVTWIH